MHKVITLTLGLSTALLSLATAQNAGMNPPSTSGNNPSNTPNYFLASQVDWVPLLPAPPRAGSPEQQRDLQGVLDVQATARKNPTRRHQAIEDSELSCFHFADALDNNPAFDEKKLPKTAEFLKKATNDGGSAAGSVKTYWKRPRPYMSSDKVEKLADMDPEYVKQKAAERKAQEDKEKQEKAAKDAAAGKVARNTPPPADAKPADPEEEKKKAAERQAQLDNTSFPSGHATMGSLCAIFLTQMLPEKQAELYARAESYRESRMVVGAHHRTDIEAGKVLATAVAAVMSQNFAFQRDELEARNELRAALGLPLTLPERKSEKDKQSDKAEKK